MTIYDATQLDTSPVEGLICHADGGSVIFPRTGYGILWAKSQAGKTLLALDAALSIYNNRPWLGHPVQHSGNVAILAGEGIGGLGVRLKARWAAEQARENAAIAEIQRTRGDQAARDAIAQLTPYGIEGVKIMPGGFPMHFGRNDQPTPGLARALGELQALGGLELVIVDTLARFKGQLSLSNDSSAQRIIQGMAYLAGELDCFVLALAHPTADGRKILGAEALVNSSDTVIQVEPDEINSAALKSATVTSRKSREDEPFPPFSYQIRPVKWDQPGEDEFGEPIPGTLETVRSAVVERIIEDAAAPASQPRRQPAAPPQLQPVIQQRKRNGIKRDHGGLHAVPDPAAPTGAQPLGALADAADRRREVARLVLSVQCDVCGRPAQVGCDKMMPPAALLIGRTLAGPLHAHDERVLDAALAQADPDAFMAAALALAAA